MLCLLLSTRSYHASYVIPPLGATCLFIILPFMLRRYTERTVVIIAVSANGLHIAMYALIWLKWQVYVIAIFTALSFMAFAGNTA